MKQIQELGDERHKTWCIHCFGSSGIFDQTKNAFVDIKTKKIIKRNKDHVPSKCLLQKPYPLNLPTLKICSKCNEGFSSHEEYFLAFLGSVSKNMHLGNSSLNVFDSNNRLSDLLLESLKVKPGSSEIEVKLNKESINLVLEKNARGHFHFETGEVIYSNPKHIQMTPVNSFNKEALCNFESVIVSELFPEIGSRLFTRTVTGKDMSEGWIIVQESQYRYAILQIGREAIIRSVIAEEFAVEVYWEDILA